MNRQRHLETLAVALTVLTGGLAAGCAPGTDRPVEPTRLLVVTRTPTGKATLHPEPGKRLPAGSQLVVINPDADVPELYEISRGLIAAGNPSISLDGQRVLFIGRDDGHDAFSLFSSAIDGSDRQRLVGAPYNCAGGAELPDGRIVLAAALAGMSPPPHLSSAWGLFVLSPEERTVQRITFSGLTELDPFVLTDGRILYSQWLPGGDGRSPEGGFALFTVHPDGTGAAPIHGHHGGSVWKLRPRQADSGDLFFLASDPGGIGRLGGSLWTAPADTGFSVALPGASPLAAEPASGDRLFVAMPRTSDDTGGLLLVDRTGRTLERMHTGDQAWDVIEAVEVRPRPRPQGQLSMIDFAGTEGHVLAIDARPPEPLGRLATTVRLKVAASAGTHGQALGDVPLAPDGSFFATVPADVPLVLAVLDADGNILVETLAPFWVRPNETRGCVGCHEDPETAPPNRRPLAVLEDPVDLVAEKEQT